MNRQLAVVAVLFSLSILGPSPARAALCGDKPNLLIVLDKSGSMGSSNKWNDAKSAISQMVSTNGSKMRFGLMLYSGSCSPGVSVGVGDNTYSAIMSVLNSNSPGGGTQTGGALKSARSYLNGVYQGKPKFVVVITDGCSSSSCGNAVSEVKALWSSGVKTFVVGFGSGVCPAELNQMAAAGQSGTYYKASNHASLIAALGTIATQVDCCGNKVLDQGEDCDVGIPAGQPGACPASCNDGDPCTKDFIIGTRCAQQCDKKAITNANPGDGCCPPGANALTDSDCQSICGNGILEGGEICDPGITSGLGKCLTQADCNDGDPCTDDLLVGSACNYSCQHNTIGPNLNGADGCCPPGASLSTDKDCPPSCGNGALEAGEFCDPGITSGPGKCPTAADCDDKDPCTADAVIGGACTRSCSNTTLGPNTSQKDGCCPTGANSLLDVDCPPSCGNGVLEKGEMCEPGIKLGPGHCPSPAECDDLDKCTVDVVIGSGCMQKCNNVAKVPDPNKKDGCCPKGNSNKTDADCPPPCGPDTTKNCVDLCQGVTCPKDHYCYNGKCVPFAKLDGGTGGEYDGSTPVGDGTVKVGDGYINRESTGSGNNPNQPGEGGAFMSVDGCSCRATPAGPGTGALFALFGLALLLRRRRR